MAKQNKGRKLFATTATAALVASAIVPVASAAELNDINTVPSWAKDAVQYLADNNILQGDEKGNFNPNATLTRAQAAEVLYKALGLDASGTENFKDVTNTNWYYEAVLATSPELFEGFGDGNFKPNQKLTRAQAAKVLVLAYELTGDADLSDFRDAATVPGWAAEYFSTAVANGVINGKGTRLAPSDDISRAEFATMVKRAIDAEKIVAGVESVKAINATTVEVDFKDNIEDIDALDFAIEGLDVKNAVVKQTDKSVAVLTTATQTGGKEYTVTNAGETVGKFTGVSAVIPSAINVTTASLQGVLGKEVSVSAQVTVPEGQSKAGIPVTFNIVNDKNTNEKIEAVAYTNDQGVATYSYTRYYNGVDSVAAYATDKASVSSTGKVYWADKVQLAVEEITTGNDLANNTKKSYKVKGAKNTTYYVTVKENINVTPDKVTKLNVQTNTGVDAFVVPAELSTGGNNVVAQVRTNGDGEATFTVYGSNLTATPVVYDAKTVSDNLNSAGTLVDDEYSRTALQAEAPSVKFAQVDKLAVTVAAEGTANSAEYAETPVKYNQNSVGGRTYTVTVTDKDGKVAPEGTTAYVTFEEDNISNPDTTNVYFSTGTTDFDKVTVKEVKAIKVGKDGKATFRVAGKGSTTFVKPTVFLNTSGSTSNPELNKEDIQQVAEATYFKAPVVSNALLTVKDEFGRTVTSLSAGKDAFFTYQSVDQNGFEYRPAGTTTSATTATVWVPVYKTVDGNQVIDYYRQETRELTPGTTAYEYTLSFDVTSLFGNATVKDAAGKVLNASQNLGNTKTYQVKSDAEGKAIVRVTSSAADTVTVNVTGSNNVLPTTSASVSFTNSTTVPPLYTGVVESFDSSKQTLKFVGKDSISYAGNNVSYRNEKNQPIANADAFATALENAAGTVEVTYEVKDGVTTFYISSVTGTTGAPTDTATNPSVTATLTDTDNDANQIGGELKISTTNSTVTSVTVNNVALTPVNGVYTVAQNTPANATIVVNVANVTGGKTASTTVQVTDVVGDAQTAAAVDTLIEGFTTPNATQAEVTAARTAYNALTAAQKALVKPANVTALQAEEAKLADAAKAAAVDALIEGFTTPNATQAEVTAARTAYDALTAAQKALVKSANLTALQAEEAKLATP